MSLGQRILSRYEMAKKVKLNWIDLWEECYDYALPMRSSFYQEAPGTERMDQVFDSTAIHATQEFASRMQVGLFEGWFKFEAGQEVPKKQRAKLQRDLDDITAYVIEVISQSNFATEIPESFLELAVSTGNLLIEEGDRVNQPIKFTAVPLNQITLDNGPFGKIDGVFRERKVKLAHVHTIYPKAKLSAEKMRAMIETPDKELIFVESLYRVWEKPIETYKWCVVTQDDSKELIQQEEISGLGSRPWLNFRWSCAAGEIYGRGPVFNALPSIREINLARQLVLQNAQLALSGAWQYDDDGVINPDNIRIEPNSLIPIAPNSNGLRPLEPPNRFDLSQLIIRDMENNIRKALFNEDLGPLDQTPRSATEIAARQATFAKVIGSSFWRMQNEMVNPLIQRVVFLLQKQGKIQMPEINGRKVKISPRSPLAIGQRSKDILQFTNFAQTVAGLYGPQALTVYTKPGDSVDKLATWYGIERDMLTTEVERQQFMEKGAEIASAVGNENDIADITKVVSGTLP